MKYVGGVTPLKKGRVYHYLISSQNFLRRKNKKNTANKSKRKRRRTLRRIRKPRGFKQGVLKSKLEARILSQARNDANKGMSIEYETAKIPYTVRKNYVPDIIVRKKSGKIIYIEVKGWFRPQDRAKTLAVLKDNPKIDLRFVFGADNKLNSRSKTRYTQWCRKYNIKCAVGKVPKTWLR